MGRKSGECIVFEVKRRKKLFQGEVWIELNALDGQKRFWPSRAWSGWSNKNRALSIAFLIRVYLFTLERVRDCAHSSARRSGGWNGESLSQLFAEHRAPSGAPTHHPWDHNQSQNQEPALRPSHPGIPALRILKVEDMVTELRSVVVESLEQNLNGVGWREDELRGIKDSEYK